MYAALDAYASLLVYKAIIDSSIDETCTPPPEFHGFKWDKSRAVVAITQILIPGALVPEYNTNATNFHSAIFWPYERSQFNRTLTATFAPKAVTDHSRCFFALDALVVDLDDEVTTRVPSTAQLTRPRPLTSRRCPPSLSSAQISSPPKALDVGAVANSCTRETEMKEHMEDFDDSLDAATAEIEEGALTRTLRDDYG
ncbi:hypothetical protein MVLG_05123 [Microbotryum lychnidis-dioicae p1A1 Lamole]|uniref:Uncharacterized protein n=1 Tax=Microbotryum lychnidis-dioicae (strain p1A1 Lamole / MvSl-1064) TaxID=683840 RepID=U5HDA7_USTV1|nr:hypothetical protein MVLG_05123 [Microbotryum lychnidis-dioicae p1A1 Lamole]|eukprot:KDE04475.1 hypothetical protein MVLG_05123 [Microbotryum lychnidis-dioicae p1A1 Lamole]